MDVGGRPKRPPATGELSRRQFLVRAGIGTATLLIQPVSLSGFFREVTHSAESIVVRWNQAALQGVRDSKLGPPMVARALAIVHTAAFDAWAAYEERAVGTRLGASLRRPPRERSLANKKIAISYAAYSAAVDLFPGSTSTVFDPLMQSLGLDPQNNSTGLDTPAGVGNVAAAAVLQFRHGDGANQLGGYTDYTGFKSPNDPMDIRLPFDPRSVHDPNAWQQLRYVDKYGNLVTPNFVGAQWQNVVPFALSSASQLRSVNGPAKFGSTEYLAQAQALLALSAGLTDEHKMIAEYWADGPNSELPPGHWDLFAQFIARRDHHGAAERGVDADVKLFFALTNAIFDASICCWDGKRAFASVRPITALRYLFQGQKVVAWAGPHRGTRLISGEDWFPYQPTTFPTPPFPEYSSGHSTFSAAGAEILRLFTNSDRFGSSVTLPAGSSRTEPGTTPARDLTLSWATFSQAADQAGISRRFGGIHFEQGDLDGRSAGRMVARMAWDKAQSYFDGAHAADSR